MQAAGYMQALAVGCTWYVLVDYTMYGRSKVFHLSP